ncbi:hypothetical protein GQX74_008027 [Glossina fuscipes]|nr:hypothetical protein GQX74_008027 [Glossina fuscipes]
MQTLLLRLALLLELLVTKGPHSYKCRNNSNSICMMRSNVCHRQDFTHKHVYKYAALIKYSPKCECLCTVLDESKSTETIDLGLIEEILESALVMIREMMISMVTMAHNITGALVT